MCVARISLLRGKSTEYLRAVSDAIYDGLVQFYGMPENDKFQIFEQLDPGDLIFDRYHGGGPRSDDFMLLNILGGPGASVETKQAFYSGVVMLLHERAAFALRTYLSAFNLPPKKIGPSEAVSLCRWDHRDFHGVA